MSKQLKIVLIFAILVLVTLLATFWVIEIRQPLPNFQQRRAPSAGIPGDLELFYGLNTIISSVNIALLVILVVLYVNIYVKTRSPFSAGLVIFALVFLVKDLFSSPLITSLYGFRAYGLGPFDVLPSFFEFFALSVLLYLSVRY